MHEVERFFTLAHSALLAWGAKPAWDDVPPKLELKLLTRHEAGARNLIEKHDIPDRFALLAPVARGVHHGKKKSWPHFNALCAPLREMGIEPIVFPSPDEAAEAKEACPDARILPPTTLGTFAALAKKAAVVVANDSGVSHIAAAVSAPQITLIGVTEPLEPQCRGLGQRKRRMALRRDGARRTHPPLCSLNAFIRSVARAFPARPTWCCP